MTRRRAVITGLGTVNPIALNVPDYWRGLLAGRSGIAPLTLFDTANFKVRFGGEVKNFDPSVAIDARAVRRLDRFTQFAMVAAAEAVADCGLDFAKEDAFRCGCILGSGIGGIAEFEDGHGTLMTKGPGRVSPFVIPKMIANSAAGNISIRYGLRGPNTTVSTACSSAAHAMGDAMRQIVDGFADVMISGGTEAAITPMGLAGFINCKALSERNDDPAHASRPFDRDRDGFVLGEGAGVLVIEEYERAKARGAKIYAEIAGCGNTADAYHITAPHEDGIGAAEAMRAAIREAGWNADEVQYINAHGTSTPLGDVAETKAVKKVFDDHAKRLMISSTKSMIGHLLGASGGVEAIACALSLTEGVLHPTINLAHQDSEAGCDLDYIPNEPRQVKVKKVLSNSFGFGGHNCSLALSAVWTAETQSRKPTDNRPWALSVPGGAMPHPDLLAGRWAGVELSQPEFARYSRHIIMPEVGLDGQKKLKAAKVLVIGTGGLGSPLALYLAAAGVGTLGLVDFDVVDLSNLQRQIIHGTSDVGRSKCHSAADALRDINPEVKLDIWEDRFTSKNAMEIVRHYDIVVDGTDNFPTRYLVNDVCVLLNKPNVYGSIFRFDGQATVFHPAVGPCYRCLYPEPPPPGEVPSCAEGGVLGILPGVIGCIQATETIKLILGIGEPLIGRLLHYDALNMTFKTFKIRRDPKWPIGAPHPTITGLIDYEQFCGIRGGEGRAEGREAPGGGSEITPTQLKQRIDAGEHLFVLDVRNPNEFAICRIPGTVLVPLPELPNRFAEVPKDREVIVHCKSGMRSAKAIEFLKSQGFTKLVNLTGGILAWAEKVDPGMPRY